MGIQIDVLPLTNYIWVILAYNSKESWDKCQCKLQEGKIRASSAGDRLASADTISFPLYVTHLVMKELGMAMSEYFYEYAMIGTLDMAYPSNQATFGHLGKFSN